VQLHRIHAAVSASALLGMPIATAIAAVPASAASSKRISGPAVNMRWGGVRVVIYVQGKRVVDVKAAYPTERARSAQINQHAIPILRSEVLKAQSANIHAVSGATNTTDAYKKSLASALHTAGI
jgi:uncharacterized protein with FMN-binding domain